MILINHSIAGYPPFTNKMGGGGGGGGWGGWGVGAVYSEKNGVGWGIFP